MIEKDSDAVEMNKRLARQEKVRIRIPLNPLNEEDRAVDVCVNGAVFTIPRGESTQVPKTVAEILENAAYI